MIRRTIDGFLSRIVIRSLQRRGATGLEYANFVGRPIVSVRPGSLLQIGPRLQAVSSAKRQVIGVNHPVILRTVDDAAALIIGADVGMSGSTIVCAGRIEIGDGCLIGANVMIVDTDFHPVHSRERRYLPRPAAKPTHHILIGRNVFIGSGAIVLKGTTIGDNTVIGAGAVVSGRVPENAIFAGNPAVHIGNVKSD